MIDLTQFDTHELVCEYGRVTAAMALLYPREDHHLRRELNAIVAECRRRDDRRLTTARMGAALLRNRRSQPVCAGADAGTENGVECG